MKTKIGMRLAALVGLLSATASMAAIGTTPHNLAGTAAGDNGELCVYCHTPHQANVLFTGAPIWNKAEPLTTFTMYGGGTTLAGTVVDAAPGASSLACLSCHDGVSAVDSILNAPGSGMNTIAGGSLIGDINTSNASTIGADLTNDHPVSIQYLGTGLADSPASLFAPTEPLTGWLGATTIADILRPDPNDITVRDRVECGSCHDPHNGNNPANEVNYLRSTNVGSALCMGCHDK
ncbi:MAG: cytochrome c3 family protein [Campylobacterota bacterium]